MDELIRSGKTGDAKSFAKKLGLSVSQTKEEIRQMRVLGAQIKFSKVQNSYIYEANTKLTFGFSEKNITSN